MAGEEGEQRRANLVRLQAQPGPAVGAILAHHPGLGWRLIASDTPIQPPLIGENAAALRVAAILDRAGSGACRLIWSFAHRGAGHGTPAHHPVWHAQRG